VTFKAGDIVKLKYDGQAGSAGGSMLQGVPKNYDGKKAKVLKVGRTMLVVSISGDPFQRRVAMASCTRSRR